MNKKIELRNVNVELVGEKTEGSFFVSGYVNKTGQWSQPLGRDQKFVEKIEPGTFKRALEQSNDIHFLAEHDNKLLLASTKNGSLVLREDDQGLFMEARISATSWGEDYYTLIQDGLLTNMSFGMQVLNEQWDKRDDGTLQRTVNEILLSEVSVVRNPAYVQSNIQARSIDVVDEPTINLTERTKQFMKFETLNLKQLEERKQELLSEADGIEQSKEIEQRSFTSSEELRQEAILSEIRTINKQIDLKNKTQRNGEIIMNTNTIETNFETEKRAVEQFLRKQNGEEIRAMQANYGTGAGTGALTIPTTLSNMIVEKLSENAPIFALTQNFTPESGFLEILREKSIGLAGFVGEMQDVTTADFTMDKVRLDQKRVGTAIELSQHLVNDSGIDVVGYSIGLLSRRLGLTLDNSVLVGDKATQFEGILNDLTIGEQAGLATNDVTIDELLDLYNSMNPAYIGGAVWVVNRKTYNKIAKLKDGNGHYHLVRDVAETGPTYKLFGQPVIINDTMPDMETGQRAVLFANFGEGYVTMTKKGLNLQHITGDTKQALRGSQLIVLDGYMDGKVLNPAAIKVLKMK
ncbi:phage major capsid protein [Bacillus toyonensis]|uniref:phage major capsid protein n=1 Tax=Bacillus toyonensis TaxID=155322 RepID=UPI002E20DFA5|nr:phage major capsid protein [Bacillus toyonensis]MED2708629.1 phage major capsid protein [Bacillus toyonensis]MED2738297.1 phage major capsid protein [Bacillus toyonensis]